MWKQMAPLLKMTHISFTFNIWTKTHRDAGLGSRFYLHWSPWSQCQWCYQQQLRHQTCSMHRQNSAADTQRNREMREDWKKEMNWQRNREWEEKDRRKSELWCCRHTQKERHTVVCLIPLLISPLHISWTYTNSEATKSRKQLNIWTCFVYRASFVYRTCYKSHEIS